MLRFNSDGKFVILQVSDTQDLHNPRRSMLKMLERAYDRVSPDLVIFTGDNILGNHLRDMRFGNKKIIKTDEGEYRRMKKALSYILDPVLARNIPFTFIYGNHDDMNAFSKQEQNLIYRAYPNLVGLDNIYPDTEAGTFNVPISSCDGKRTAFNLWCFDSARQTENGGLEAVTRDCLDWYKAESARLKKENGGVPVPSLIFQHIPMKEQNDLVEQCEPYSVGARAFGKFGFQRLTPELCRGTLGEPISAVKEDFGEADAIKECGDVLAVVTGHDHTNQFDGRANGIRHIQTAAASFRCYGSRDRGVRVFVLDENKPESFETYTLSYSDLCGDGAAAHLNYIMDADGEQYKKAALLASFAIAGALVAAAGIKIVKRIK